MNKKNSHSHHLMSNHTPKTMPQLPYIPLKGYRYHAPTRQAGFTTHVPLCPDGEGQGHRDAQPHHTASRTHAIGYYEFYFSEKWVKLTN